MLAAAPQADLAKENERLRVENRILREGAGHIKKGYPVLRAGGLSTNGRLLREAGFGSSRDVIR